MSDILVLFFITIAVCAAIFFYALAKAAKMGSEAEERWRRELEQIERTFKEDEELKP